MPQNFPDMGEPRGYAKAKIILEDFPGLINNIDPFDSPAGAADIQTNACSILMGELRIRAGVKECKFEAGA